VTCSWSEERFERLLDGELADAERVRVLAHVDTCADCSGLLEELRVVDGLLIEPRAIPLPDDFTHATMNVVKALPEPRTCGRPLLAWLVSSVVAGWAFFAAALLIAPLHVLAFVNGTLTVMQTVFGTFGGLGRVFAHLFNRGELGSWTTFAGSVVIADLLALAGLVAVLRYARPRLGGRLRW
jgi:anti-sigma factor RsiW